MTFTMLRSDVPSSHRIQKPTPHTSLRPNVPTVAARVKVKEVKAVAVVKPLYNVPTTVASQSYCLQLPGKNPEVVPASEGGRHNHWYCLCWWQWQWNDDNDDLDDWYVWDRPTQGEDIASVDLHPWFCNWQKPRGNTSETRVVLPLKNNNQLQYFNDTLDSNSNNTRPSKMGI